MAATSERSNEMSRSAATSHRFGAMVAALSFIAMACAPAGPGGGSAFVRQDPLSAGAGGGNFDVGAQAALNAQGGEQITDKTLVIGIAAEVRGFSQLNNLQNKYGEDLIHG